MFYTFVEKEYAPLHKLKETNLDKSKTIIDRMTYANMLDSMVHKGFKRQAYSTLSSYFDMFKRSESLRQVPMIGDF